jgi:hypothetical protein
VNARSTPVRSTEPRSTASHGTRPRRTPARSLAIAAVALICAACSGPKPDQYRTVTSYEFASCDSRPTTDAVEMEALRRFRDHAGSHWFRSDGESLYAAMHERTAKESGVREYRGEPYWYLHPLKLEREDTAAGIDWKAVAYLHAREVRSRRNGDDWTGWQRVRTRNFGSQNGEQNAGRTADGLGRWACLVGAEVAWAEITRRGSEWTVTPLAAGPYGEDEIARMEPRPTEAQVAGDEAVPAGAP